MVSQNARHPAEGRGRGRAVSRYATRVCVCVSASEFVGVSRQPHTNTLPLSLTTPTIRDPQAARRFAHE